MLLKLCIEFPTNSNRTILVRRSLRNLLILAVLSSNRTSTTIWETEWWRKLKKISVFLRPTLKRIIKRWDKYSHSCPHSRCLSGSKEKWHSTKFERKYSYLLTGTLISKTKSKMFPKDASTLMEVRSPINWSETYKTSSRFIRSSWSTWWRGKWSGRPMWFKTTKNRC